MTTSTLETVSGLVEQINATGTGVKVPGQWLNIGQYHALPKLGQHVEVQVQRTDRGQFAYGQSEQRGKQQPVQSKAIRRAKGRPTRAGLLARLNELTELARRRRLRQLSQDIVKRYAAACGIHAMPHAFRRAMLENDAPISLIQELLGHPSPTVTRQLYAAYEQRTVRAGFDKYNPTASQQVAELEAEQERRRGGE